MLLIADTLDKLDFEQLMEIYTEGNREYGEANFPELPLEEQMLRAKKGFHDYLIGEFFQKPGAMYAAWIVDDSYVSALRLEPNHDGLLMEALETLPSRRQKGYASALIQAVQLHLGSCKIYSHVSKQNTASLATHAKCGFRKYLDYSVYGDGTVNERAYTMCYEG